MTVEKALALAIRLFPLDLVERMRYMQYKADSCNADDRASWLAAIRRTRGLS